MGPDATRTMGISGAAPGAEIGPYRLIRELGEGGMGVVYRAQQTEPIRREVALKIIKPGMDSKQVIARFEAEGQALALMDHQNIAKVFDAGTTESGRPSWSVTRTLDGLTSRWMIPFWCACWIAWQTGTNSSNRCRGVKVFASQYSVIGTPWTSSMTKYGRPLSVVPAS